SSVAGHAFSLDWGLLAPLAVAGIMAAVLAGRTRLALYASLWTLLSFAGIVLVFWISVVPIDLTLRWAAYRTVASLVIGAAALAPLLVGDLQFDLGAAVPRRRRRSNGAALR